MTADLVLDHMHVPVEVGGRSRRARLTIERDGSLRLRAAGDVATDELRAFLASKRESIYKKLAEKEAVQHEPVTKELVEVVAGGELLVGGGVHGRVVTG